MFHKRLLISLLFFLFVISNCFAIDESSYIQQYLNEAISKIKSNAPVIATEKPIVFEIKVLPNGNLMESKIIESSGNKSFDDGVMEAVKKSAPFGKLPEEMKMEYIGGRFNFGYKEERILLKNNGYNVETNDSGTIKLTNNGQNNLSIPPQMKFMEERDNKTTQIVKINDVKSNDGYILNSYFDSVYKKIMNSLKNSNKMVGQAKFTVLLKIARDGSLVDCFMTDSTGSTRLDKTMLEIIRESAPFDPIPDAYTGEYIEYKFYGNSFLYLK